MPRPHYREEMSYRSYTLLPHNLPGITIRKAPRIPRIKTSQKGRKDAQEASPRSVAPLPREDEVEPSHKRVFCFQRGHTKPSPC
jgi:hypothetical protein